MCCQGLVAMLEVVELSTAFLWRLYAHTTYNHTICMRTPSLPAWLTVVHYGWLVSQALICDGSLGDITGIESNIPSHSEVCSGRLKKV